MEHHCLNPPWPQRLTGNQGARNWVQVKSNRTLHLKISSSDSTTDNCYNTRLASRSHMLYQTMENSILDFRVQKMKWNENTDDTKTLTKQAFKKKRKEDIFFTALALSSVFAATTRFSVKKGHPFLRLRRERNQSWACAMAISVMRYNQLFGENACSNWLNRNLSNSSLHSSRMTVWLVICIENRSRLTEKCYDKKTRFPSMTSVLSGPALLSF